MRSIRVLQTVLGVSRIEVRSGTFEVGGWIASASLVEMEAMLTWAHSLQATRNDDISIIGRCQRYGANLIALCVSKNRKG
jgi:hypothetical protein